MPLIRYRTGDIGCWGRDCPCGRGWPVLKSLEGRIADIIELPSGRMCPSLKFYFPSHMKSDVSGIRQYQVVQREPGLFVFRYVQNGAGPGPECAREIREKIMEAAGEAVSVELERAESIPRGPGGKMRHVIPYRRR
jgi:phenylacetate-CoA ligase